MRDVARAAGVSVETVYASFRSKGDLLMAALDVAVVGDAGPVPLDQRPEFAALGSGTLRQRRINVEQGAAQVAGRVVTAEEVDGLWALVAVEIYQMLTELRGWTPQQYENWLADVIQRLLPGPDGTGDGRT